MIDCIYCDKAIDIKKAIKTKYGYSCIKCYWDFVKIGWLLKPGKDTQDKC